MIRAKPLRCPRRPAANYAGGACPWGPQLIASFAAMTILACGEPDEPLRRRGRALPGRLVKDGSDRSFVRCRPGVRIARSIAPVERHAARLQPGTPEVGNE